MRKKDADQLRCNRGADQCLCFRYMGSTNPLLPKSEISSLKPSSMAVQPGLCRTWSKTRIPVSHNEADISLFLIVGVTVVKFWKDRFSQNEARLPFIFLNTKMSRVAKKDRGFRQGPTRVVIYVCRPSLEQSRRLS